MTKRLFLLAALLAAAVTAGTAQAPQGAQSQGAIINRPGANRQPTIPPPSIIDYKPKSTLVVAEHPVPRAKYPVIDIHSHQPTPMTLAQLETVVKSMDPLNASGATGQRLIDSVAAIRNSPYKDRMVMFTNINFTNVDAAFVQRTVQQLEQDKKNGALGVGEISKAFGLRARKADGTRLKIDDPILDPIWEACARLNLPVLIHTADPQEFFQPITLTNERWLELALYPDRRYPAAEFPSFETISTERDNLFRHHPKTTFIMAHLGWHANNLGRVAKMFDAMPNVYGEVGAVLYDLGRQPRTAREFMTRYQDRVLFGKDSYQPDEFPYYWRVFETADEYFDYYRDYHAFWKLYGLELPDAVLKKLYYQNALKLVPGIPKTGFPN
jgi:uncharacterized protein